MKTIKTFLNLCLGYGVIFLSMFGIISSKIVELDSYPFLSFFCIFLLILFYPPTAFGYLFYKQTGKKPWLYSAWISPVIGICTILFIRFVLDIDPNAQYADLIYLFWGVPVSVTMSLSITASACILRKQWPITRALGFLTFIGMGATILIGVLFAYLAQHSELTFWSISGTVFFTITMVALGVLTATCGGSRTNFIGKKKS